VRFEAEPVRRGSRFTRRLSGGAEVPPPRRSRPRRRRAGTRASSWPGTSLGARSAYGRPPSTGAGVVACAPAWRPDAVNELARDLALSIFFDDGSVGLGRTAPRLARGGPSSRPFHGPHQAPGRADRLRFNRREARAGSSLPGCTSRENNGRRHTRRRGRCSATSRPSARGGDLERDGRGAILGPRREVLWPADGGGAEHSLRPRDRGDPGGDRRAGQTICGFTTGGPGRVARGSPSIAQRVEGSRP
jgi:hypothetical protein